LRGDITQKEKSLRQERERCEEACERAKTALERKVDEYLKILHQERDELDDEINRVEELADLS
jgi:CHASE1-domain containing sensor protein